MTTKKELVTSIKNGVNIIEKLSNKIKVSVLDHIEFSGSGERDYELSYDDLRELNSDITQARIKINKLYEHWG